MSGRRSLDLAGLTRNVRFQTETLPGVRKVPCFFISIVDSVLAEKAGGGVPRTRAIIVYPMNALANSQLEELNKFLANVPGERPVTYARYTGQKDAEERRRAPGSTAPTTLPVSTLRVADPLPESLSADSRSTVVCGLSGLFRS